MAVQYFQVTDSISFVALFYSIRSGSVFLDYLVPGHLPFFLLLFFQGIPRWKQVQSNGSTMPKGLVSSHPIRMEPTFSPTLPTLPAAVSNRLPKVRKSGSKQVRDERDPRPKTLSRFKSEKSPIIGTFSFQHRRTNGKKHKNKRFCLRKLRKMDGTRPYHSDHRKRSPVFPALFGKMRFGTPCQPCPAGHDLGNGVMTFLPEERLHGNVRHEQPEHMFRLFFVRRHGNTLFRPPCQTASCRTPYRQRQS